MINFNTNLLYYFTLFSHETVKCSLYLRKKMSKYFFTLEAKMEKPTFLLQFHLLPIYFKFFFFLEFFTLEDNSKLYFDIYKDV
jgi:hypothetical protein